MSAFCCVRWMIVTRCSASIHKLYILCPVMWTRAAAVFPSVSAFLVPMSLPFLPTQTVTCFGQNWLPTGVVGFTVTRCVNVSLELWCCWLGHGKGIRPIKSPATTVFLAHHDSVVAAATCCCMLSIVKALLHIRIYRYELTWQTTKLLTVAKILCHSPSPRSFEVFTSIFLCPCLLLEQLSVVLLLLCGTVLSSSSLCNCMYYFDRWWMHPTGLTSWVFDLVLVGIRFYVNFLFGRRQSWYFSIPYHIIRYHKSSCMLPIKFLMQPAYRVRTVCFVLAFILTSSVWFVWLCLTKLSYMVGRWKLSDGNSDTTTNQQSSADESLSVDTSVDSTTRSSQLASVRMKMREIWSLIADQPAKDFDHYAECLELVSRGLVCGKVEVMVEHLRHLLEEPTNVTDTSRQLFVVLPNGNNFITCYCIYYAPDRCTPCGTGGDRDSSVTNNLLSTSQHLALQAGISTLHRLNHCLLDFNCLTVLHC